MNTVVLKHQAVSTLVIATHAASVTHCRQGWRSQEEGGKSQMEEGVHFSELLISPGCRQITAAPQIAQRVQHRDRNSRGMYSKPPTVLQPAPIRPGPQRAAGAALAASAEAARRAASSRRCWVICSRRMGQGNEDARTWPAASGR